jgi:hypothetical protein
MESLQTLQEALSQELAVVVAVELEVLGPTVVLAAAVMVAVQTLPPLTQLLTQAVAVVVADGALETLPLAGLEL